MRIAYLKGDTRLPSTAANTVHVMKMCAAFARQGHEVTLYTQKGFREKRPDIDVFDYYGVEKTFKIVYSNYLPVRGGYFLYKNICRLKILLRKTDIIYARNIPLLKEMIILSKPVMLDLHDRPTNQRWFNCIKEILDYRFFIGMSTNSFALKREYLRLYPNLHGNKITVAHNCADIPKKELYKNSSNNISVGYVGSLYEGRGFEVIKKLARYFNNTKFHIVGGTKDDIKREKEKCKYSNLIFEGFIPNGKINESYAKFDIVLAPYQRKVKVAGNIGDTSKIMSPLKLFEYMSYKKAIICSDLPVLKEVMREQYNCLLCDPENTNEWINALNSLLNNDRLREELSENAYNDFLKHYTWNNRAEKITKVINEWKEKNEKED